LFSNSIKAQVTSSAAAGITHTPPIQNQQQKAPPVANAGPNQVVYVGSTVILNGRSSYDPNPSGSIVYYRWVQVAGIPVSLVGSNTASPTFTAPIVRTDTPLAFSLR